MEHHKSCCPINLSLEVFGDRWSLLIIRDLMFFGKRHFRELLGSEEKIASNILTDRLSMLEEKGIITKSDDPDHRLKYIYSLTKRGIDLLPILSEIGIWGLKHQPYDEKKYGHTRKIAAGGRVLLKSIQKELEKAHLK